MPAASALAFLLFAIFHFRHITPDGFLQLSFAIDYCLSLFYYFSLLIMPAFRAIACLLFSFRHFAFDYAIIFDDIIGDIERHFRQLSASAMRWLRFH
jgi:hypothetical protein